jgi:hypothetical protein
MASPDISAINVQPPSVATGCAPLSAAILPPIASANTSAPTTWQVRIVASRALFSSIIRALSVSSVIRPNASSVGANTVNGPGPDNVSTRPACVTAATSFVWIGEFTAFSMTFFSASISAPPTIWLDACASANAIPAVSLSAAAVAILMPKATHHMKGKFQDISQAHSDGKSA